ncbi:hypothetical protein [Prosthecobacter sp.]|uniref:hypothetical protein n=1 Tax=Prosthecobacter sp. TaxID=1965333 RepID=UPI0037844307
MKAIPLFINAGTGELRRTLTQGPAPRIAAILGTTLELTNTFFDDEDAAIELDEGSTGRLVCRSPNGLDAETVLLDSAWDHTSGQTTYSLKTLADSEQLRYLIKSKPEFILSAQVEFTVPGEDAPRKSLPFDLVIINGPARGDEGAPDVNGSVQSAWLTERAPRIDIDAVLTSMERTQLLTNIGNVLQQRLSDDGSYVHFYNAAGIYKGSATLLDLGQANL